MLEIHHAGWEPSDYYDLNQYWSVQYDTSLLTLISIQGCSYRVHCAVVFVSERHILYIYSPVTGKAFWSISDFMKISAYFCNWLVLTDQQMYTCSNCKVFDTEVSEKEKTGVVSLDGMLCILLPSSLDLWQHQGLIPPHSQTCFKLFFTHPKLPNIINMRCLNSSYVERVHVLSLHWNTVHWKFLLLV